MALTTMDQLVAALAAAQYADIEDLALATTAGQFFSLWRAGGRPATGALPGSTSGVVPTSATAGAIPYTDPGPGNTGYLARMEASCSVAGSLILYDRLMTSDGLSGTVITAQTVGSPALTRSTSGGLWLEWYTATGATAVTATISYTDQNGTAGNTTTVAVPASMKAGQVIPVPLAAGDTAVQAVASVTLSATTGTAGSFGVTLAQRVVTVPIPLANIGTLSDYAQLGLPTIPNGACLAWKMLCTSTTSGVVVAGFTFIQG